MVVGRQHDRRVSSSLRDFLASLSPVGILLGTVVLSIAFEAITATLRFGFGLQATRDTAFISKITFGIRVHHGYIGTLILLISWTMVEPEHTRNLLLIVGGALMLSDLIHHFLVLWPITGSPEFHLTYRQRQ